MATSSKDKPLLPVYLIVGEDALKRDAVLKRLRLRLEQLGDLEFNSDYFDGTIASALDIVSACNTIPFASEVRLVVLSGAEHLKDADAKELVTYIENPCDTTILVLVAEKLAKNKKLYKSIAKVGVSSIIECTPLKRYELPKTVRSMAVSHGITMTNNAARLLVDLVGEDTVRLNGEVKKLAAAHFGKDAVTDVDVRALIAKTTEPKPWEFVDALCDRDVRLCMSILCDMKSANPHQILGMSVTRIRELICAKSYIRRGDPRGISEALHVPDWRVKNHASWARNFSESELRLALVSACDTERRMKSGADALSVLQEWVLSFCVR